MFSLNYIKLHQTVISLVLASDLMSDAVCSAGELVVRGKPVVCRLPHCYPTVTPLLPHCYPTALLLKPQLTVKVSRLQQSTTVKTTPQ